jgi:hypothetical protein
MILPQENACAGFAPLPFPFQSPLVDSHAYAGFALAAGTRVCESLKIWSDRTLASSAAPFPSFGPPIVAWTTSGETLRQ